eukprot:1193674-Rhodomonas_salina.1
MSETACSFQPALTVQSWGAHYAVDTKAPVAEEDTEGEAGEARVLLSAVGTLFVVRVLRWFRDN